MNAQAILSLIYSLAVQEQMDGNLMAAVAITESELNPNAKGSRGETGLFQIRANATKLTHKQLLDPISNAREGIRILKEASVKCKFNLDNTFPVCYNFGYHGAGKLKSPYVIYLRRVLHQYEIQRGRYSMGTATLGERLYGKSDLHSQ